MVGQCFTMRGELPVQKDLDILEEQHTVLSELLRFIVEVASLTCPHIRTILHNIS